MNPIPEAGLSRHQAACESLSACMDGELEAKQQDALLVELKAGDALLSEWGLYHCIGDVLRSDELACQRAGFQSRFATLLQAEPHVFAPQAAAAVAGRGTGRKWIKPASLAASVAAIAVVAGVVLQQRSGGDSQTARLDPPPPQIQPAVMVVPTAYLAAHREYASGLAMQGMVAHIRTVAHDSDK